MVTKELVLDAIRIAFEMMLAGEDYNKWFQMHQDLKEIRELVLRRV